jgi:hypothetical protein
MLYGNRQTVAERGPELACRRKPVIPLRGTPGRLLARRWLIPLEGLNPNNSEKCALLKDRGRRS